MEVASPIFSENLNLHKSLQIDLRQWGIVPSLCQVVLLRFYPVWVG
jgi:hypothetical protein